MITLSNPGSINMDSKISKYLFRTTLPGRVFGQPSYICGFILAFVVLNGLPTSNAADCYDTWSDCLRELKSEFEVEHDGAKETEGDTMVMHYTCVDTTLEKSPGCLKEITDGVCNPEDKELATSMGSETLDELTEYCEKWKLEF